MSGIGAIRCWKEHLVSEHVAIGTPDFAFALHTINNMEAKFGVTLLTKTVQYYRLRKKFVEDRPYGKKCEKIVNGVTYYYYIMDWTLPRRLTEKGYVYSL